MIKPFDYRNTLFSKSHVEIRDFFIEEFAVDIDSPEPFFTEEETELK